MDKSKIVVFRNGGHIALREKWKYGGTPTGNCEHVQVFGDIFFYPALLFSRTKRHVTASQERGHLYFQIAMVARREIPINILQTV